MRKRYKDPFIPVERHETIRQEIISVIDGQIFSAKEISGRVGASEKEVYEHLEHIQRTINKKNLQFIITPSECMKCGFVFRKRDRLKKPGKCPICHAEKIQEPLFSIER